MCASEQKPGIDGSSKKSNLLCLLTPALLFHFKGHRYVKAKTVPTEGAELQFLEPLLLSPFMMGRLLKDSEYRWNPLYEYDQFTSPKQIRH